MQTMKLKPEPQNKRIAVLDAAGDTVGYIQGEDLRMFLLAMRARSAEEKLNEEIGVTMKEHPGMSYAQALTSVAKKNPEVWHNYHRHVFHGRSI